MDVVTLVVLCVLMGMVAALYTSVGHAGASGYLAVMALFAVPATVMRPTALVLNILVASLATFRFVRAGQFNLRLLLPFVLAAIPAAFLAGRIQLPGETYRLIVGLVLWIAAVRFLWPRPAQSLEAPQREVNFLLALLVGTGVGVLSGLTGTGGGIFLSPVILLMGWETPRKTSGVAAAFILCVSIAGLAGSLSTVGSLPAELPWMLGSVLVGALIGTQLGIRTLPQGRLLQALGVVLILAGAKLIFT